MVTVTAEYGFFYKVNWLTMKMPRQRHACISGVKQGAQDVDPFNKGRLEEKLDGNILVETWRAGSGMPRLC
jgi:hypothetical protein